jgi:hypothetical protein
MNLSSARVERVCYGDNITEAVTALRAVLEGEVAAVLRTRIPWSLEARDSAGVKEERSGAKVAWGSPGMWHEVFPA